MLTLYRYTNKNNKNSGKKENCIAPDDLSRNEKLTEINKYPDTQTPQYNVLTIEKEKENEKIQKTLKNYKQQSTDGRKKR